MESSHLPSEIIIYEILSRVSKNTLGRCQVASKEWKQTTYDSKFKMLHSQMNNGADGFFVQIHKKVPASSYGFSFSSISDETLQLSLDFVPGFHVSLEAVSAIHGIIFCSSVSPRHHCVPRFFVCKPLVKLYQRIPVPRAIFLITAVAISVIRSKPFRYKILVITSSHRMLFFHVFDSETWTWKRLEATMLPNHTSFWGCDPAVTVCGSFHWLINPNLVFSFVVEKEEWKVDSLPIKREDYGLIKLVEYEGKLALICMDSEAYMHTWVMENYKNQVWKKKFVINMKDPDREDRKYIPMAFYGSDIIAVRKCKSLMYYNFKNGNVLKEEDICPVRLFPIWSDSESCCLRRNLESGLRRKRKKRSRINGVFSRTICPWINH